MPKLASDKICTGCMLCGDICPKNAISFEISTGYYRPKINSTKCIECKLCEKKCPETNPTLQFRDCLEPVSPLAGWSLDTNVRKQSASGGAFIEISNSFISLSEKSACDWAVVGAAIKRNFVRHIIVKTKEDLRLLQGTKYLASDLSGIYKKVLEMLKAGVNVLFSGLPCEINALYVYLHQKTFKGILYTCDLICNGVPSFKLLDLALDSTDEILSFRDKKNGWGHETALTLKDKRGNTKRESLNSNYFLKALCANHLMRNSCYNCKYCNISRPSDFTLGDFWGCELDRSLTHDGVSLIIPHTKKAMDLIKVCDMKLWQIEWSECLPYNPRIYTGKRYIGYAIPSYIKRIITNLSPNTAYKLLTADLRIKSKHNYQWIPYKLWINILKHLEYRYRKNTLKRFITKLN